MSLFSKLTKHSEKTAHPWSQKKLNGVLPRTGHASAPFGETGIVIYGGIYRGSFKKELVFIDTRKVSIRIFLLWPLFFLT